MGTDVMPSQPDNHDICHASAMRGEELKCVYRAQSILYMPMASSAPATNSSKPISAARGGEATDPWLTISAWIWVAYFAGVGAAVISFIF